MGQGGMGRITPRPCGTLKEWEVGRLYIALPVVGFSSKLAFFLLLPPFLPSCP